MRVVVAFLSVTFCMVGLMTSWAKDPAPTQADVGVSKQVVVKETVSVFFGTEPRRVKATVYHGRKKLGKTPFTHEFKRESGPVDLVFKAYGHVTVNTRAHTFQDAKLIVKMTKKEDRSTIYGYKEEIPPDAGVPPATSQPSSMPTAPPVPATQPVTPPKTP